MKHSLDSNFNLTLYLLSDQAQLLILRYFIVTPLDNPGKYKVRHAWLDGNSLFKISVNWFYKFYSALAYLCVVKKYFSNLLSLVFYFCYLFQDKRFNWPKFLLRNQFD